MQYRAASPAVHAALLIKLLNAGCMLRKCASQLCQPYARLARWLVALHSPVLPDIFCMSRMPRCTHSCHLCCHQCHHCHTQEPSRLLCASCIPCKEAVHSCMASSAIVASICHLCSSKAPRLHSHHACSASAARSSAASAAICSAVRSGLSSSRSPSFLPLQATRKLH